MSRGLHAAIAGLGGFSPEGSRHKQALLRKVSSRSIPLCFSSTSSNFPLCPTNGLPILDSVIPGASPTIARLARSGPQLGTYSPYSKRGHFSHSAIGCFLRIMGQSVQRL